MRKQNLSTITMAHSYVSSTSKSAKLSDEIFIRS